LKVTGLRLIDFGLGTIILGDNWGDIQNAYAAAVSEKAVSTSVSAKIASHYFLAADYLAKSSVTTPNIKP
jgi:hypothetical protein